MEHVQQVMVVKDRPNHLLHLILTLLTAGFWAPVWLLVSMSSRLNRMSFQPSIGLRLVVGVLVTGVVFALLF